MVVMDPIRVLIVEDEFPVASCFAAKLERLGYEIAGSLPAGPNHPGSRRKAAGHRA